MHVRKLFARTLAGVAVGMVTTAVAAAPSFADAAASPVTGGSATAVAHDARLAAVQIKSARWNPLHSGDCEQDDGTIVVRSDGTGDFSATTLTYHTHSGDVWHASFDFSTSAGFRLFQAGTFDSPRMDDGNPPPRYFWSRHFVFNPSDFANVDIFKTVQHYSC